MTGVRSPEVDQIRRSWPHDDLETFTKCRLEWLSDGRIREFEERGRVYADFDHFLAACPFVISLRKRGMVAVGVDIHAPNCPPREWDGYLGTGIYPELPVVRRMTEDGTWYTWHYLSIQTVWRDINRVKLNCGNCSNCQKRSLITAIDDRLRRLAHRKYGEADIF